MVAVEVEVHPGGGVAEPPVARADDHIPERFELSEGFRPDKYARPDAGTVRVHLAGIEARAAAGTVPLLFRALGLRA